MSNTHEALAILSLSIFAVALFLVAYTARDRATANADRELAERAKETVDSVDLIWQLRRIEVSTLAALPPVRGFAA